MTSPGPSAALTEALADAVSVDPRRRDREIVLGRAASQLRGDQDVLWARIEDPETRRRVGYLVDVVQHARGQERAEAQGLAAILHRLPARAPCPFWPGERSLPAGTDPIAERWGFSRGVDVLRLRAAMTTSRVELLPDAG
jgi:hypothetical protein